MGRVDHPSPAKVVGKIMCRDTVKADHPLFETTVVGVYVLHVINLADDSNTRCQIDWAMSDASTGSTQRCVSCSTL